MGTRAKHSPPRVRFILEKLFKAMLHNLSVKARHFFHVVSNVRPLIWLCSYIALVPLFALIYWALPDSEFRIPDNGGLGYGSWLYYSIVTISTLGFGDYTPMHGWAQAFTAIEVVCGLSIFGFFLNSVGSMKSEIEVESEIERQRIAHEKLQKQKFLIVAPSIIHSLNVFLSYCYAVTTPVDKRTETDARFNPNFRFSDMADLFKPSGLPFDNTRLPAVARLMKCATHTSLALDSMQTRVDLTLWPKILEESFAFVANYQMFSSVDSLSRSPITLLPLGTTSTDEAAEAAISQEIASWTGPVNLKKEGDLQPVIELYYFIRDNAELARKLEADITAALNS